MKDPWGNTRAAYLARGVKLPPRDSFEDQVMTEMLNRERHERIVMWEYSMAAVGLFMGLSKKDLTSVIDPLKKDLTEDVFQRNFVLDRTRRRLLQQKDETSALRQQIERLDNMARTVNAPQS